MKRIFHWDASAFGVGLVLACSVLTFGVSGIAMAKNIQGVTSHGVAIQTPTGLAEDVKFWERVFSQVSVDECLMHDAWNLDAVYSIERIPGSSSRGRLKVIQAKKQRIRAALSRFAVGGRPANEFERKVLLSIPKRHRTIDFYTAAKDRVRCQRGVDLNPSLARSQKYLPLIRQELKKVGLPQDLAYLPHLESGFDIRAHSRAGAKGIWQFTRGGAKFAGLRVGRSPYVRTSLDQRLDPVASTKAAVGHLAEMQLKTLSWPLTITAYNYGPNGVSRAIRKFGPDYMKIRTHHKTRIFGFAARNYFPSFLAVRNVAQRFEREKREQSRKQVAVAANSKNIGAL